VAPGPSCRRLDGLWIANPISRAPEPATAGGRRESW
jgi:hypothetical protein